MSGIDMLDVSPEMKIALKRRRNPPLSLRPPARPAEPVRLSETQRRVLKKLQELKGKPASFSNLVEAAGNGTLKALAERGLVDIQIRITGSGVAQIERK